MYHDLAALKKGQWLVESMERSRQTAETMIASNLKKLEISSSPSEPLEVDSLPLGSKKKEENEKKESSHPSYQSVEPQSDSVILDESKLYDADSDEEDEVDLEVLVEKESDSPKTPLRKSSETFLLKASQASEKNGKI